MVTSQLTSRRLLSFVLFFSGCHGGEVVRKKPPLICTDTVEADALMSLLHHLFGQKSKKEIPSCVTNLYLNGQINMIIPFVDGISGREGCTSALHIAVQEKSCCAVKEILRQSKKRYPVDLTLRDGFGRTPYMYALQLHAEQESKSQKKIVKMLAHAGSLFDPDAKKAFPFSFSSMRRLGLEIQCEINQRQPPFPVWRFKENEGDESGQSPITTADQLHSVIKTGTVQELQEVLEVLKGLGQNGELLIVEVFNGLSALDLIVTQITKENYKDNLSEPTLEKGQLLVEHCPPDRRALSWEYLRQFKESNPQFCRDLNRNLEICKNSFC